MSKTALKRHRSLAHIGEFPCGVSQRMRFGDSRIVLAFWTNAARPRAERTSTGKKPNRSSSR
jgi:hypothetical protein